MGLIDRKLKEFKMYMVLHDLMRDVEGNRCSNCKKKFIPDKKSVNDVTKKWDEHTYRASCKCYHKDLRFING